MQICIICHGGFESWLYEGFPFLTPVYHEFSIHGWYCGRGPEGQGKSKIAELDLGLSTGNIF